MKEHKCHVTFKYILNMCRSKSEMKHHKFYKILTVVLYFKLMLIGFDYWPIDVASQLCLILGIYRIVSSNQSPSRMYFQKQWSVSYIYTSRKKFLQLTLWINVQKANLLRFIMTVASCWELKHQLLDPPIARESRGR